MPDLQPVRISGPTLKALSLFLERNPSPLSGADLINEKKILSGTLYPLLDRLEAAGWLESEWENVDPSEVGRPRKRLYRLTGTGARSARSVLREHGINITREVDQHGPRPDWVSA